jgi:hypothetical protein
MMLTWILSVNLDVKTDAAAIQAACAAVAFAPKFVLKFGVKVGVMTSMFFLSFGVGRCDHDVKSPTVGALEVRTAHSLSLERVSEFDF